MPLIEINGAEFFYTDQGSGYPVVFTHGLGGDHTMWARQMPVFARRYRLICWDVRGHGRSEVTEGGYSIEQFVKDLHDLLMTLEIGRAHFSGLSMGGLISWNFTLTYPKKVNALVLSNSAGILSGVSAEQVESSRSIFAASASIAEKEGRGGILLENTLKLMFSRHFMEREPLAVQVVRNKLKDDPGLGYARTIKGLFMDWGKTPQDQIEKRLNKITAPTLVLAGDEDQLTPLSTQQGLAGAIPGAKLHVFEETGHVSNLERAEEWNKVALDFLDSVER